MRRKKGPEAAVIHWAPRAIKPRTPDGHQEAQLVATAPAAPAALPFGLTAREAGVLRLLAQVLPDAQIAARLILSPCTVKAHLCSIYAKRYVASRRAATRFALEHHLS